MTLSRNQRKASSALLGLLLAWACALPAQAAGDEGVDWQQLADQARQAAQDRAAAQLDRLQTLRQIEEADLQARQQQLQALRDYDVSRIERQAQLLALNSMQLAAVSPELQARRQRAVSADSADGSAGGGGQVNERHPLNADGRVYVNDVAGTVVVNGWNRNEVLITGELGSGVDHLEVSGDANELRVMVKLPKHSRNVGESDLRLMVPAGAAVELETVSADTSVQGVGGAVKVTTVSGDVGLDVQSQEVAVQTVSGDMIVRAPARSTQANTVSGDMHLSGLQGRLNVESVSGNLSVKGSRFSDLKLKSVSGDMGLDASFSPQARVVGETLSGNITLHVPADMSGTAMIKSFSGETQCDLPQSSASASHNPASRKREFTFGEGHGVSLQLSSFSGDVRIDPMNGPIAVPAPPPPPAPPAPPAPPPPPPPPSRD